MKAKLTDYLFINPKKGRLTVDVEGDFRKVYDELKDLDVDVEIAKYRPKRSLDANAYAWVMIHKIASKMREEPVVTYRKLIRDFSCKVKVICCKTEDIETEIHEFCDGHIGRMVDIGDSKLPGCVVLHKKYGSSSFDSAQMSAFIEIIKDQCHELGIETRSDEEIKSLLEAWK